MSQRVKSERNGSINRVEGEMLCVHYANGKGGWAMPKIEEKKICVRLQRINECIGNTVLNACSLQRKKKPKNHSFICNFSASHSPRQCVKYSMYPARVILELAADEKLRPKNTEYYLFI